MGRIILAVVLSFLMLLSPLPAGGSDLPPRAESLIKIQVGDVVVAVEEYEPIPGSGYHAQFSPTERKVFPLQYRVGGVPVERDSGYFADSAIYLAVGSRRWTRSELGGTVSSLVRARTVASEVFGFDPQYPGLGNRYRRSVILILNELTKDPRTGQTAVAFRPSPMVDLFYQRFEARADELSAQYVQSLSFLAEVQVTREGQYGLSEILLQGLGEYAYFRVTGNWRYNWRYTAESKEGLENLVNHQSWFYQDLRSLSYAGMLVAEADENWPGVWGRLNARLATKVEEIYGGREAIYDGLWEGRRPTLAVERFLELGDGIVGSKDFSSWFRAQRVFTLPPWP